MGSCCSTSDVHVTTIGDIVLLDNDSTGEVCFIGYRGAKGRITPDIQYGIILDRKQKTHALP